MDTAYTKFMEEDERLKQLERESGLFTIDTYRNRPGLRHKAHELERGWMQTMCGHRVINYFRTGMTSQYFSDGTVWVHLCPICFPEAQRQE